MMTPTQARELLKGLALFGDRPQIEALQLLEKLEAAKCFVRNCENHVPSDFVGACHCWRLIRDENILQWAEEEIAAEPKRAKAAK